LQNKWLSETQFKEVLDLCWSLPGPTTLQVIITIVTLKTRSLMVGVNSFIVYNILPWIFLTILGLLSSKFVHNQTALLPLTAKLFFMGFNAATAGIMVRNFVQFMSDSWQKWPKIALTLVTAGIFYFNQSIGALIGCLALGAVVSLYQEVE
jgi:chromate transport protein ChrA